MLKSGSQEIPSRKGKLNNTLKEIFKDGNDKILKIFFKKFSMCPLKVTLLICFNKKNEVFQPNIRLSIKFKLLKIKTF